MSIEEQLKKKRKAILRMASRHGAYNVRVFGFIARGERITLAEIHRD